MMYRKAMAALAAALLAAPLFAQSGAPAPSPAPAPTAADAGVLVVAVQPGSPAAVAGLARGDIILEANGKTVNDAADLRTVLGGITSGANVTLAVTHGDARKTLTLVAGSQDGRPWLGILPLPGRGERFAFPGMGEDGASGMFPRQGALVQSVSPDSPAQRAGLARGDVILSVDGTPVDGTHALSDLIAARKVGDTVTLSVTPWRQSAAHDVKVTLAKNPDKDSAWLGLQYLAAPARFGGPGMTQGARVADVLANSPASRAGIAPRDLITKFDGVEVTGPRQIVEAVGRHKPGDTVSLTLVRQADGKPMDVTVTLGASPNDTSRAWLGVSVDVPGPAGYGPGVGAGRGWSAPVPGEM